MARAKITVVGNVGGDPEMKYSESGLAITTFSVAVGHREKNRQSGEWEDGHTDWYRCTAFGDRAERMNEQIQKGMQLVVFGGFKTRPWTSRETGKSGTALEVTVDDYVLPPKSKDGEERPARSSQPVPAGDMDLDDLPF